MVCEMLAIAIQGFPIAIKPWYELQFHDAS